MAQRCNNLQTPWCKLSSRDTVQSEYLTASRQHKPTLVPSHGPALFVLISSPHSPLPSCLHLSAATTFLFCLTKEEGGILEEKKRRSTQTRPSGRVVYESLQQPTHNLNPPKGDSKQRLDVVHAHLILFFFH